MPNVAFVLTMPNAGSWNGKWSGEGRLYARTRLLNKEKSESVLSHNSYYYSWPDGWGAKVEVRKVTSREASKIRTNSNGFCGYDWMIDSILANGKILSSSD